MPSSFRRVFAGRKHVFLPVVHVLNAEQALRNATKAHDAGADGIFLISHIPTIFNAHLLEILATIRAALPGFWVGINSLQSGRDIIYQLPSDTPGLWCDDGGVHMYLQYPSASAQEFVNIRTELKFTGLYFGGVAFKGQRQDWRVTDAACAAKDLMDVITTSGDETGVPPDPEKITLMKACAGSTPLAVASGMTPENVGQYLAADCFLVSTGISIDGEDEFDMRRMLAFGKALGR